MTLPFIYYTLNYNTALYATFFVVLHNYFFNIQYCTPYSLLLLTSQTAPSLFKHSAAIPLYIPNLTSPPPPIPTP